MAHKNKLPERYPDIIAMYARGRANSLEILKADFGHWPPNGLDIVNAPDIDVTFKSVFSTKYGLKRLVPGWGNLFVMANLLKSYPVSAVAFMAVTAALRGIELGGFVDSDNKPRTIHLNDMYRAFGFFQGGRRFLSHIISHEFKHVVQVRDKEDSLSSSLDGDRLDIRSYLKDGVKGHVQYLAAECELQARLHTVIVGAYHQFERLPLNRKELYAALQSQGVNLSPVIEAQLIETGRGALARDKFTQDEELFDRYADKSAIGDLNKVLENIRPEKVEAFWDEVVPFIYGDLLELYGDQQGHKRMGHMHNIQLREIFYKSAEQYRTEGNALRVKSVVTPEERQSVQAHSTKALEVIDKMDKEDAVELGCKIVRGDLYQEYGHAACVSSRSGNHLAKAALEKIWERRDVTEHDRLRLKEAAHQVRQNERQPRRFTFVRKQEPKSLKPLMYA